MFPHRENRFFSGTLFAGYFCETNISTVSSCMIVYIGDETLRGFRKRNSRGQQYSAISSITQFYHKIADIFCNCLFLQSTDLEPFQKNTLPLPKDNYSKCHTISLSTFLHSRRGITGRHGKEQSGVPDVIPSVQNTFDKAAEREAKIYSLLSRHDGNVF